MPIYEYNCDKCDVEFETLVMGSDVPECPDCGSKKLTKLMSGFAHKSDGKFVSDSSGCNGCSATSCKTCH